jgi:hypothetical protein
MQPARHESSRELLDRELVEILQELRVAVAGVQILFAFLLTLPFSTGFHRIGYTGRWVYYVSLVTAAVASICFIAPATQHRILFRSGRKDLLISRSNRYGIAGAIALTVSMACGVEVAARGFFSSWLAAATAMGVVLMCAWAWFIQPLLTRKGAPPPRAAYQSPPGR